MVNTRSGSGVDQPAAPQRRARNNTNPDPQPSQPHQTPPAGMEQFLAAQTQLLTNMANTIANMQAQMNQAPPPPPPPARDRHREFMSHKPPTFSHSPDPLQADDWIKTVEKMLNLAQCTDREKVLYASGRLEGTAADWWDAYTAASAPTGRRSFMLQADWKGPLQIGGMPTQQLMTTPTPSAGRNSEASSGSNTYPKA
jgi:hypothetical protein